jgi:hypothetical protein
MSSLIKKVGERMRICFSANLLRPESLRVRPLHTVTFTALFDTSAGEYGTVIEMPKARGPVLIGLIHGGGGGGIFCDGSSKGHARYGLVLAEAAQLRVTVTSSCRDIAFVHIITSSFKPLATLLKGTNNFGTVAKGTGNLLPFGMCTLYMLTKASRLQYITLRNISG